MLQRNVIFTQNLLGNEVEALCENLQDGEVMLLENIRFYQRRLRGIWNLQRN